MHHNFYETTKFEEKKKQLLKQRANVTITFLIKSYRATKCNMTQHGETGRGSSKYKFKHALVLLHYKMKQTENKHPNKIIIILQRL